MTANGKVVINLATGLEDAERVTVAFLVGVAAVEAGKQVAMFLTKGAVLLAWPGGAEATACEGCPPLSRLFQQYADGGRRAARLSDLRQGAQARRVVPGRECETCWGDAALGVDRRGRDRLQLLALRRSRWRGPKKA